MDDRNKKAATKQWFHQKYLIPGVVGCVDGTHLFLQRPRQNEEAYFNRKGRHSINAIIICDHKMRIICINPRYTGSAHDSLVWKHSNERAYFEESFNEQDQNCWLLGDSGYPLEPLLLTPCRTSTDASKTHFNEVHAKARNVIERCIGVYKGRGRILLEERKTRYDPDKLARFANVCAALHNEENFVENEATNYNSVEVHIASEVPIANNRLKQLAERKRNEIKDALFV